MFTIYATERTIVRYSAWELGVYGASAHIRKNGKILPTIAASKGRQTRLGGIEFKYLRDAKAFALRVEIGATAVSSRLGYFDHGVVYITRKDGSYVVR